MVADITVAVVAGLVLAPYLRGSWPAYIVVIPMVIGFRNYPFIMAVVLFGLACAALAGAVIEKRRARRPEIDLGTFPEPTKRGDLPRFPAQWTRTPKPEETVQVKAHTRAKPRRKT